MAGVQSLWIRKIILKLLLWVRKTTAVLTTHTLAYIKPDSVPDLIPARMVGVAWSASCSLTINCPKTPQVCGVNRIILLLPFKLEPYPQHRFISINLVWYLRFHVGLPHMEVMQEPMEKSTQGSIQMLHTFTVCTFNNTCTLPSLAGSQSYPFSPFLFLNAKHSSRQDSQLTMLLYVCFSTEVRGLMSVESLLQTAGLFWMNRVACAHGRSYH